MRIDKTHTPWIIFSILLLGAATAYYVPYHLSSLNGPSGNSWTGLGYGILGSIFILFCGALGMRKSVRTWRLGKARSWLRAHIWLGLLSFPMILFHCGFDFGPRWSLTWVTMWLFVTIMISGIFGVIMQHYLPRMMMTRITSETVFEQIDTVVDRLRWEGDFIVSGVCGQLPEEALAHIPEHIAELGEPGKPPKNPTKFPAYMLNWGHRTKREVKDAIEGSAPIKDFYLSQVQPYILGQRPNALEAKVKAAAVFERVRTLVPENLHETVLDLESICEERRQLDLQRKLHKWLHTWLLVHGPVSYLMILLASVHAVAALYY